MRLGNTAIRAMEEFIVANQWGGARRVSLDVWRLQMLNTYPPGMAMVGFIPLYGNRSKAEAKLTIQQRCLSAGLAVFDGQGGGYRSTPLCHKAAGAVSVMSAPNKALRLFAVFLP